MSAWINRTLSKVEIQEQIGRGGMAEVYLGRHTTLNRQVAVKILHSHLSEDSMLLSRFRSEAQAVAGMRHPNIVQVFDFDVADGGRPYIVMELLQGPSLKEHLDALGHSSGQIAPATLVLLISQLASALDYAHARGIIHRDIKPANVILRTEKGTITPGQPLPDTVELVLTDFGIARMANTDVQTASGTIIGTPAYMSPEQVRGEGIDHRSDIYSLGIMLYEMLAGRVPFDAESQASVLIQQLTVTPPPLEGVSFRLQNLIDTALAKDPNNRFQTAGDLASALKAVYQEDAGAGMRATGVLEAKNTGAQATIEFQNKTAQMETASSTGTLSGEERRGLIPVWLAAGFGGLALIVAVIALVAVSGLLPLGGAGSVPSDTSTEPAVAETNPTESAAVVENPTDEPSPTEESAAVEPSVDALTPLGVVTFLDNTLNASLADLQPEPDGSTYEAWLTGANTEPLSLGLLAVAGGQASIAFVHPAGEILLTRYDAFVISIEPADDGDPAISGDIAYRAEVSAELLDRVRHLYEYTLRRDEPFRNQVLDGAVSQAGQYSSHLGFAVDALNNGNLLEGKLHAEHVNNIVSGIDHPDYGDINGDGRTENPGDDVGLERYLLLIQDSLNAVLLTSDDDSARQQAEDLLGDVQGLIQTVQDARRQAQRITVSDNLDEARELVVLLDTYRIEAALAALVEEMGSLDLALSAPVFIADQ